MGTWTDRGHLARTLGWEWGHLRDPAGWTAEEYYWAVLLGAPFYALLVWMVRLLAWPFRAGWRALRR